PDFEESSAGRIRAPGFRWPEIDGTTTKPSAPEPLGREEEFTRATTLGLFDYTRKSRSRGAVVSLSGGADSAATSALVALMLRSAALELGLDGVKAKLSYMDLGDVDGVGALVERLLLCVYQSTRNSSETTLEAARAVAEGLGAEFAVLDVDSIVEAYREKVEGALGRPLTWERDDLTLQNIQARSRSPGIWMFANLRGALLLSTSNRSEAAVGYATMDGDTSGGLSPIAGIDKAFLRRWLRWLEVEGLPGLGPIPSLAAVNRLAPTAELRPEESGQTDEDDLMPYDVLDLIEREAIGRKKVPIDVFRSLRHRFPDVDVWQLGLWIERFFRLWARNQWKRERYAPSFHVDDENLDPKTWCRFPILSGGFDRELRELRRLIDAQSPDPPNPDGPTAAPETAAP
ncbi:MAG: NAD(+) synthase, partial [Acidobacteriota bacterium]